MVFELGPDYLGDAGDTADGLIDFLAAMGYAFFDERDFSPFRDLKGHARAMKGHETLNVYCEPGARG
jgi:hypothetical protein